MTEHTRHELDDDSPPGTRTAAIVRWGIVAVMALVAAGSLLHYFGAFSADGAGSSSNAAYHCPMHPSVVQDQPGDCPICGMTLVARGTTGAANGSDRPQSGAESPAAGTSTPGSGVPELVPIELTPERIQLLGMRTAQVTREALLPEIRTVGFVAASEKALVRVHTRFSGWIEELRVAETGAKVARGQVLAAIYSPEVLAAQQEYLNALRWSKDGAAPGGEARDLTRGLADDAARRLELLGVGREDIAGIARTGNPVRALPIRAPASGHVTRKNAVQGIFVQPGAELFELADLSTVWVLADVYEHEVERVRVGQGASVRLASLPRRSFEGTVTVLSPTIDPSTRTLRVRLELKNPDLQLRPGMYGDVVLRVEQAEGLVVPIESVVDTGERQYVFVAREGGRFEPRLVGLGNRTGTKVEVTGGLEEGETVVTTANFFIDSESRLRAAIEGLSAGGGPGAAGSVAAPGRGQGPDCETDFDREKYPDRYRECRACELQHRGMGTMEEDCKNAIARPWR